MTQHSMFSLFLGHSKSDGGVVTTDDLRRFFGVVSRYFPGFTATEALGYWKGQREGSTRLDIVAPDTAENRQSIEAIAGVYVCDHGPQSVMMTVQHVTVLWSE